MPHNKWQDAEFPHLKTKQKKRSIAEPLSCPDFPRRKIVCRHLAKTRNGTVHRRSSAAVILWYLLFTFSLRNARFLRNRIEDRSAAASPCPLGVAPALMFCISSLTRHTHTGAHAHKYAKYAAICVYLHTTPRR